MHCYYAVTGRIAKPGGMIDLCRWAQSRIAHDKAKIVKILKARPGESTARIVLEITSDGISSTRNGRIIHLSALKKATEEDE